MSAWMSRGRANWAFLGILALMMVLWGCGRKGRPIPKDVRVPRAVTDFQIKKAAGAIQLSWEEPEKDLRGDKLKNLAGYKVLRKRVKPGSNECIDCPAGFSVTAVLDRDHPVNFKEADGAILWRDKDVQKPGIYVYRIVPFNSNGYNGAISTYVSVKIP